MAIPLAIEKKQAKMSEFVGFCRNSCLLFQGKARNATDLLRPNPPHPPNNLAAWALIDA